MPAPHRPPHQDDAPTGAASIRTATLAGIRWYAVVRFLAEVAGLATSVVLARLIAPAQFGAVAIAFGLVSLAAGMLNLGLVSPLVQRRDVGRVDLEATSFLSLASAALLVLLFEFVLPPITKPLFGDETTRFIQISALAFPFVALGVVPGAQLQRRLDFQRLSAFELISQISGAVVSVSVAATGAGGEAIILGSIASAAVQALVLCRSAPLARPIPHRDAMRGLLGFGASAGLASIVYSAYQNIDYMILGARLGAAQLGYYWRAFQLGVEYQGKVSRIMLQLAFPIYSRLNDLDAIKRMRARIVRVHASVLFPLLMLLAAVAPVLIPFVYGDRWTRAVLPTQILSIAGLVAVVGTGGGPLLLAAGKPRWLLGVNVTALTFFSVVVYLMAPLGVVAVCISVAAYQVTVLTAVQLLLQRLLHIPVRALVADVGPALVGSLALCAVAFTLTHLLSSFGVPAAVLLLVVAFVGLGTYAAVMRVAFRPAWSDLMLLRRTVVPAWPTLAAVLHPRRRVIEAGPRTRRT
jgi:O-antigen/teichoic acid export membrane protein